ncbi:hypothetical protein J6590_014419 [Homalodisca vitripennis]|nr:hypothetical protein J6590_014419 [Homalodisca vitripennis]
MGKLIQEGSIFPPPENVSSSEIKLPFVAVGDEAFKLGNHVMKPYTHKQAIADVHKRHFNYATCRARRVTENAFVVSPRCVIDCSQGSALSHAAKATQRG